MFTPDNDQISGANTAPSSLLGGPRYSWFTVWDNDTVDQLYIDNIGSGPADTPAVPEPTSLALLGIGGIGLAATRRLRRKQTA